MVFRHWMVFFTRLIFHFVVAVFISYLLMVFGVVITRSLGFEFDPANIFFVILVIFLLTRLVIGDIKNIHDDKKS